MTIQPTSRRAFLAAAIAVPFAPGAFARMPAIPPQVKLKSLEEATKGGRLGVAIIDTQFGGVIGHRLDERFAMCSTFKMPLIAAILHKADTGELKLDEVIRYSKEDLLSHAPVTRANVDKGGMSICDLAKAAQTTSDGVAANLLMKRLGGPEAVTKIWRGWGDAITRIDRYEPEMNRVTPGSQQDTTTPYAMATLAEKILNGNLLKPVSRDQLIRWMIDTGTGAKRIRAGLAPTWKAGDKTGSGYNKINGNHTNDVAIIWPPDRPPIIVAAYLQTPFFDGIRDEDQQVLADVGRIVSAWLG